jgi:hypothetical protein
MRALATGRWRALATTVTAGMVGLAGCGVHLHDPGKEKAAADIRARYAEVKLLDLIEIERKNLDALLAEELAAARETDRVVLELELVRIAEGREPIGLTLASADRGGTLKPYGRSALRLQELGWASIADLRQAQRDAVTPPEAESRSRLIYSATGRRPPPCDAADLDEGLAALSRGITDPGVRAAVESDAGKYKTACGEFKPVKGSGAEGSGDVGLAYRAWQAAKAEQAEQRARVNARQEALRIANEQHDAALKAVQAADTPETRKRLQEAAAGVRRAIAALAGPSDGGGAAMAAERARAIDVILGAVAGGDVDAKKLQDDPDLARAAAVASALPSIAEGIEGMVRRAKAPLLGGLVLEKEHQLLQRDHAQRLERLAAKRVELREARYRALVLESRFLMERHDALCRFTGVRQTPAVADPECDAFTVTVEDGVVSCRLVADRELRGDQCPVAAPWSALWGDGSGEAKRHLYRAIIALVQRFAVARAQQDEADYGLVHLLHQEVTAADEYAIRAWNALIATPINQLAAYHQSGVKPAELADLIVKAIGLGAIGIGVNR